MFKVRLLSGIALLLVLCSGLYWGGWFLYTLVWLIAMIGLYEYQKAIQKGKWKANPLNILGFIATTILFKGLLFGRGDFLVFIGILYFIILLMIYVFSYPKWSHRQLAEELFGFIYIPTMLIFLCLTRDLSKGAILVWLIPICSWGSDTCAYCVGMLIGKHKMAPILSPKKSIEGAVGGILGSGLLAGLLGYWQLKDHFSFIQGIILLVMIGMIGAFISMIGDLVASGIKREYEIKDYGNIIPGHGGILDRFDSMIMISPIIFWLCHLFMGKFV